MSRNCPQKNTVKGNGKNKPPGLPSYSMEMSILEDINNGDDLLDSMPVGSMNMRIDDIPESTEINEGWRKWYPSWQHPQALAREKIGNCYEMMAEYLLTTLQPYPGDEIKTKQSQYCSPDSQFEVKSMQKDTNKFQKNDYSTGFKIMIDKSRLGNPRFNLGHWYAKKRAKTLGIRIPTTKEYSPQLENPIVLVTKNLLQNGSHSHFPSVKLDTWNDLRFFVYLKDYGSAIYIITDEDLELRLEIKLSDLENLKFNLIEWYLKQIRVDGMFYKKYIEHHKYRYQQVSKGGKTFLDDLNRIEVSEHPSNMSEEISVPRQMALVLERCAPYPGDDAPNYPMDPTYRKDESRFILDLIDTLEQQLVCVYDRVQGTENYLSWSLASWNQFSLGKWYAEECAVNQGDETPWETAHEWMKLHEWNESTLTGNDQ